MKAPLKLYYWLPRALCLLAILFISMFAADSFAPGRSLWQQIEAFLIHLIPSFVLLGLLILAWKREFIGGIVFILLGIGLSPLIFIKNYNMNHSVGMSLLIIAAITLPFIIVGILFLVSHTMRKKMVKS
jgi:cytochrome b561